MVSYGLLWSPMGTYGNLSQSKDGSWNAGWLQVDARWCQITVSPHGENEMDSPECLGLLENWCLWMQTIHKAFTKTTGTLLLQSHAVQSKIGFNLGHPMIERLVEASAGRSNIWSHGGFLECVMLALPKSRCWRQCRLVCGFTNVWIQESFVRQFPKTQETLRK